MEKHSQWFQPLEHNACTKHGRNLYNYNDMYPRLKPWAIFKKHQSILKLRTSEPKKKHLQIVLPFHTFAQFLKFIVRYHERRRDRPDETLATLYYKEGAKFYFLP